MRRKQSNFFILEFPLLYLKNFPATRLVRCVGLVNQYSTRGKGTRRQTDRYKPAELKMASGKEGSTSYKLSERRDDIFNKLNNEEEGTDQYVFNIIRDIENSCVSKKEIQMIFE